MEYIRLDFKPLTIVIPKEREEVYVKVKKAFEKANKLLADPDVDIALKLEMMRVLAVLAQCLLRAAKDIRTEELIEQLEGLEAK